MNPSKLFTSVGIGMLIGVAIWSAVNNGLSIWTLFPLLLVGIALYKR